MIIPKMYDIEIISSNYNPDKNTSITITATAIDYNGNPVLGEPLVIKHNGVTIGNSIVTDSNGQASVVTTCGSGGTHQFSCKSSSCMVTVNPYPIGAIYISTNGTDPSTLFGGTWTQIEDRFLLASGTTYSTLGNMGGEATHTLTENEMPSHTHTQNQHTHNMGTDLGATVRFNKNDNWGYTSKSKMTTTSGSYYYPYSTANNDGVGEIDHVGYTTATNQNKGGGQAHNNMPPYLVVSVWERTA